MPENFDPNLVSPPGDTISDILEELGWTLDDFCNKTDFSMYACKELISGELEVTAPRAEILARVLGSSKQFWLERERQYREALFRQKFPKTASKIMW